MLKTDARCESLLRAAGCSRKVVAHCLTVGDIAEEYARNCGTADLRLVRAGALLHDIGRGGSHSLCHAQEGAALCRETGLPEEVCRIVECHTGAGLSADECTLLRLLPVDCIPSTLEEKIVANADNLARGSERVSIEGRLLTALSLNRKVKRRLYRLWLEMEQIRRG